MLCTFSEIIRSYNNKEALLFSLNCVQCFHQEQTIYRLVFKAKEMLFLTKMGMSIIGCAPLIVCENSFLMAEVFRKKVNNMEEWIHPDLRQRFSLVVVVV